MYNRNIKPGCTPKNGTPFICRLMPFVGISYPVIKPFICSKIPLVRNRGFSLIELIITLTVAGILMAIAVPNMQQFVASNRLTSQVNDLMGDINLVKTEAIKKNTAAGICVTAVGGTSCVASGNWANGWLVYYVCPTGDPGCTAGNNVAVKVHEALTGNNTLTLTGGPVDAVTYDRRGIMSSVAAGTYLFTLCDPRMKKTRMVTLEVTGRPAISEGTC